MAATNLNVLSLNAATTTITAASYVQLTAATPIAFSQMIIVNTTAKTIIFGYGASSSEIGLVACGPSMQLTVNVPFQLIPAGTRVALNAVGADASTGIVTVSFML